MRKCSLLVTVTLLWHVALVRHHTKPLPANLNLHGLLFFRNFQLLNKNLKNERRQERIRYAGSRMLFFRNIRRKTSYPGIPRVKNPEPRNRSFNRISRIPISRIFRVLRSEFPGFKFTNLGHQQSSSFTIFRSSQKMRISDQILIFISSWKNEKFEVSVFGRVGFGFFRDRDFLFWDRSKNPENLRDWDRDLKIPKKSQVKNLGKPGDRDRDLRSSKKYRVQSPKNAKSLGFGILSGFFNFGISRGFITAIGIFFSWDGISRQKAISGIRGL